MDADLGACHRLESLAGLAHISAFHFRRIYRRVTGERLGLTLRRMRLARAAFRLIGSGESVTRIALDLGYDSPQAFARAFRGFSGLSPRDFQGLHAEMSHRGAGVSRLSLAPFSAIGLVHRGPLATIPHTYRDLLVKLGPQNPQTLVGICRGNPDIPGNFHYVAAAILTDSPDCGLERFALGGYTVLSLAGARTDRDAFFAFCASPARDAGCRPPEMDKRAGSDTAPGASVSRETAQSVAHSGESFRDPRIKAVFVMAPALGQAFHSDSFNEITASLALVGGDQDRIVPPGSNIRRYASYLPMAQVTMIEGAGHYSLLDDCIPEAINRAPLLCAELPGVKRDTVHAQVVELALRFFSANLLTVPSPK